MKDRDWSRREILGAAATIAIRWPSNMTARDPYEEAAKDAVRWIRAQAVQTGAGKAWPAVPGKKETVSPDLYSGTAGVALLLAEAGARWKAPAILEDARQAAKEVQSWGNQLYDKRFLGLYTGLAGAIWLVSRLEAAGIKDETWHEDPNLDLAAVYANDLLRSRKTIEPNDVIEGLAGIGLAALAVPSRANLHIAEEIGNELVARGKPDGAGLMWPLSESYTRNMPNFSHGTAGVAFFLAKLYSRTRKKPLLEATVKGAEYLKGIANTVGDGCLIYHADPDGLNRYYLGWCHGPAGTSQLWWQLSKVTGDSKWKEWATKSAKSLLDIGVPEKRTEGYWNNEGLCCGTAGIGRFFLDMFRRTGEIQYLEAARRCASSIMEKAIKDEEGTRWSFAEHRVKPEEVSVQSGWMQGAAGIAAFLMEMSSPRKAVFTLPVDAD